MELLDGVIVEAEEVCMFLCECTGMGHTAVKSGAVTGGGGRMNKAGRRDVVEDVYCLLGQRVEADPYIGW